MNIVQEVKSTIEVFAVRIATEFQSSPMNASKLMHQISSDENLTPSERMNLARIAVCMIHGDAWK